MAKPSKVKRKSTWSWGYQRSGLMRLKALGYDTVDKIKALEKPGKLHQEMMGYRKKNKLEIGTVTMEQVSEWIS